MPKFEVLSAAAIARRAYWIDEIVKVSGRFGEDTSRIEAELKAEIERDGVTALTDHLRLCGSIPEHFGHDTSEEKLYSKYTDVLLAAVFSYIGLTSLVILERADAADVEAVGKNYSLVADAKAFRLSRTAKNQKDFKVDAMHGWKRGKLHALVVCPIYQLPARTSQIYQQAIARKVCIFTYSHLAVLVSFCGQSDGRSAQDLLLAVLGCAESLNPTKSSVAYWACINHAMLDFDSAIAQLWGIEKIATLKAVSLLKDEALTFLAKQREAIMKMSREDAITHLIRDKNIAGREAKIRSLGDNKIFSIA